MPISTVFFLFILTASIYIIPLPEAVIKALNPVMVSLREKYALNPSSAQTLSIYPRATFIYLIKLMSYLMIFLVIVSKVKGGDHSRGHGDQAMYKALKPSGKEAVRVEQEKGTFTLWQESRFIFLGALTGVLTILFHSICDFNLHIPANALYFTGLLAVAAGLSRADAEHINYEFLGRFVDLIISTGFIVGVFGIIQKFSGTEKMYWVLNKPGAHFGPYVNYDHFAGYMEMCASLAAAKFVAKISCSSFFSIRRIKDKLLWFSSAEANKTLIYLFTASIMVAALFMSTSRGGIMSFAASMVIFYFACLLSAGRKRRNRLLYSAFLGASLIGIMIIWIGPEPTAERFRALNRVVGFFINEKPIMEEIRPFMWKDTARIVRDFPFTGTGLGTFSYIYPKYRTFSLSYGFLRYTHNDYLQLVSEMGIPGIGFIVFFLVWYTRRFKECLLGLKNIL
ncbi:MAG: O-antigen ligase family protein [Candidatus Omnitrophota bacterium]